jgi:hypothetical protein
MYFVSFIYHDAANFASLNAIHLQALMIRHIWRYRLGKKKDAIKQPEMP